MAALKGITLNDPSDESSPSMSPSQEVAAKQHLEQAQKRILGRMKKK